MSVELVDASRQLPIAYRNTIANMMAEAEAQNGIFAADDDHAGVVSRRRASTELPYPRLAPGRRRALRDRRGARPCRRVVPMMAKPFSPGNAFPAEEIARERITFDKAIIGSCTNGSYDDLLQAALVVTARRARRASTTAGEAVHRFPGLGRRRAADRAARPAARRRVDRRRCCAPSAAEIRQSWCGPCFGQGPDALARGQRAITSFNRNWQNRMGVGGEGYLASPAVVAASALLGYMAPPGELGLRWDADEYGV